MGSFTQMTDTLNTFTKDKVSNTEEKCVSNPVCDFVESLTGIKLNSSTVISGVSGKRLEDKGVLPSLQIGGDTNDAKLDARVVNVKLGDTKGGDAKGGDAEAPASPRKSAVDMANQLSSRAEMELKRRHNGEQNTISGSGKLREIKYTPEYNVKFQQSPQMMAILELGPDVTSKQRDLYAKAIFALNQDKLVDDGSGQKVFKAGEKIKLPGQTADGGITYMNDKESVTLWNDSSMLRRSPDGSGQATFKQDGNDVSVSWNRQNAEGNKWSSEILTFTPDGKTTYMEKSETTFDSKGRVVQRILGADEKTVQTVRVADSVSTIELKRGKDGDFHGRRKVDGKVVAGDLGMTADGRIYKRKDNADGTIDKTFEDTDKTETFNGKGKLVKTHEVGKDNKITVSRYNSKGEVDSMTITDKDKNVVEVKLNKDGNLEGVKKDKDGKVIDHVGMNRLGWYSQKDTPAGYELTYENGQARTYEKSGSLLEIKQKDAKGRTIVESYKGENTATVHETDGTVLSLKKGPDGDYHGERKDAAGKVLENNVGMTKERRFFTQDTASGIVSRKYEDGESTKQDAAGNFLERVGKDAAGREAARSFRPGETTPYKIEMQINGKGTKTEFNRTRDGRYLNEEKSKTGETIRTIEVNPNDATLVYKGLKDGSRMTVYKDGSSDSEIDLGGGNLRRTRMKTGELVTTDVKRDAKGSEQTLKVTSIDQKNGVIFESKFTNGFMDGLTIRKPTGIVELALKDGQWKGTSIDWFGRKEDAIMYPNASIMYKNRSTGEVREEKITKEQDRLINELKPVNYDVDTGNFVHGDRNQTHAITSRAPGRVDAVGKDGTISGVTITGDISYQKPDGEAAIVQPTLEGGRLTPDGKITTWSNGVEVQDNLTSVEAAFLSRHPETDRRNVLEIHRRFADDKKRIDAFYAQLERAYWAPNLSREEKNKLVGGLMHHVAHPAEIYQGGAPTCGIANVERDMAITQPEKYASFVMDAVTTGEFKTATGTNVSFDIDNLKAQDFSGRDIASRAFQTAALNVLRYPHYQFENALNGGGQFHKTIGGSDWLSGEKDQLGGLYLEELARMRNQLTGESKAVVHIDSPETLVSVFKKGGGKPMTIWVDSNLYPFGSGSLDGGVGGHFTMITGVQEGPPARVFIQNQFGLEKDHSTRFTAIEAQDIFNNMSRSSGGKTGYVLVQAPDSGKRYQAQTAPDGSITYKEISTAKFDPNGKYVP